MLQLIELFTQLNYKVIFGSPAQKTTQKQDLTLLNVEEVSIVLNHSSFDAYIKELQPQIVLFDRFMMEEQFGWRVFENSPNSLRILDTEDLHCLRKTRTEAVKKGLAFTTDLLLQSELAKREIATILRCDLSLIISSFEMDLLQSVFKIDPSILYQLPFLFPTITEEDQLKWPSFEERKQFVFIGNFLHAPNVDAVLVLKSQIWSKIKRQLPEAELHIYGAYTTQQIQQLHNKKEGFIIKGHAPVAIEVVGQARVLLAPLRFGAGIKGKLTEAMICGTPSVTTSIGAEGMSAGLAWSGVVEDNFDLFAKEAVKLYTNKNSWQISQKNGVKIINQYYTKESLTALFSDHLDSLFQNLESHRIQNFLGNLLQHHSLKSAKYMSKWIEEKNKL